MTENERNEFDARWYGERYLARDFALAGCPKPQELRDAPQGAPRSCRFCGRANDATTFRKRAHAVPEFLGNKCLISMNECDGCNEFFSTTCEDHLSKAMGPIRTLSQICGKNGIPVYKDAKNELRVEVTESIRVEVRNAERLTDDGISEVVLEMPTQPHVPLLAAKCLVKIGCSIAPSELLGDLSGATRWVRMPLSEDDPGISDMPVLWSFVPGPSPYGNGHVTLLERRPSIAPIVPRFWVVVGTGNVQIQTIIPFAKGDKWDGSMNFSPQFYPVINTNNNLELGRNTRHRMNWATTSSVVGAIRIAMHYDGKTEVAGDLPN